MLDLISYSECLAYCRGNPKAIVMLSEMSNETNLKLIKINKNFSKSSFKSSCLFIVNESQSMMLPPERKSEFEETKIITNRLAMQSLMAPEHLTRTFNSNVTPLIDDKEDPPIVTNALFDLNVSEGNTIHDINNQSIAQSESIPNYLDNKNSMFLTHKSTIEKRSDMKIFGTNVSIQINESTNIKGSKLDSTYNIASKKDSSSLFGSSSNDKSLRLNKAQTNYNKISIHKSETTEEELEESFINNQTSFIRNSKSSGSNASNIKSSSIVTFNKRKGIHNNHTVINSLVNSRFQNSFVKNSIAKPSSFNNPFSKKINGQTIIQNTFKVVNTNLNDNLYFINNNKQIIKSNEIGKIYE